MGFGDLHFKNRIKLKKKIKFDTKYELKKIKRIDNTTVSSGNSAPQGKVYFKEGRFPFIRAENLNKVDSFGYIIPYKKNFVNAKAIKENKLKLFPKGTILFPKSGQSVNTNNIGILNQGSYVVSHLATVKTKNLETNRYIFNILKSVGTSNLKDLDSDYPTISKENIENLKMPLPKSNIRKNINQDIRKIEKEEAKKLKILEKNSDRINKIIETNKTKKSNKLSYYLTLEYGIPLPERKRKKGDYPVVGSNGIIGYHNTYYLKAPSIIMGRKGSAGEVNWIDKDSTPIDTTFYVKLKSGDKLKYVYYVLKSLNLPELKEGMGSGGINRNEVHKIRVSIPSPKRQIILLKKIEPLEEEIKEVETYLKETKKLKNNIINKYLN